MTPTELARRSDISRARIYKIEADEGGRPNTDTLFKLANGLSTWRSGETDAHECAEIFRQLQLGAGYPVDQVPTAHEQGTAVPVPPALAGPMEDILARWSDWGNSERAAVAHLLKAAAELGINRPDSLVHSDPSDNVEQNQTVSPRNKQQKLLALYLDKAWLALRSIGHLTDTDAHRVPGCPGGLLAVGTR